MDLKIRTDPYRPGLRKKSPVDVLAPPCSVCGKFRPRLAVRHDDPFCSTECCRVAHGCELPVLSQGETYDRPDSSRAKPMVEHGRISSYRKGCRCIECKDVSTTDRRLRRQAAAARARQPVAA